MINIYKLYVNIIKILENLYNLIKLLDYIDKKGYSLNVRLYHEFNKLNFSVEITDIEKYIFKDVYITSLMIN